MLQKHRVAFMLTLLFLVVLSACSSSDENNDLENPWENTATATTNESGEVSFSSTFHEKEFTVEAVDQNGDPVQGIDVTFGENEDIISVVILDPDERYLPSLYIGPPEGPEGSMESSSERKFTATNSNLKFRLPSKGEVVIRYGAIAVIKAGEYVASPFIELGEGIYDSVMFDLSHMDNSKPWLYYVTPEEIFEDIQRQGKIKFAVLGIANTIISGFDLKSGAIKTAKGFLAFILKEGAKEWTRTTTLKGYEILTDLIGQQVAKDKPCLKAVIIMLPTLSRLFLPLEIVDDSYCEEEQAADDNDGSEELDYRHICEFSISCGEGTDEDMQDCLSHFPRALQYGIYTTECLNCYASIDECEDFHTCDQIIGCRAVLWSHSPGWPTDFSNCPEDFYIYSGLNDDGTINNQSDCQNFCQLTGHNMCAYGGDCACSIDGSGNYTPNTDGDSSNTCSGAWDCDSDEKCIDGKCVYQECSSSFDCSGAGEVCVEGSCVLPVCDLVSPSGCCSQNPACSDYCSDHEELPTDKSAACREGLVEVGFACRSNDYVYACHDDGRMSQSGKCTCP